MRNYLIVVGLFVLGLFFAGGVYSQYAEQQMVEEAISNGVLYLEGQEHLDSELFILYLLHQKTGNGQYSGLIEKNVGKLDSFHAPISQFIQGRPIEKSSFSSKTLEDPFYGHLIDYFSCVPLSQAWIDSLSTYSNDETSEGLYKSAHALIVLELLERDYLGGRCGSEESFSQVLADAKLAKVVEVQSFLHEKDHFDVWVERVGALAFAGISIPDEDVGHILDMQAENGGWSPRVFMEEEEAFDEERPHTTVLAIWALMEATS